MSGGKDVERGADADPGRPCGGSLGACGLGGPGRRSLAHALPARHAGAGRRARSGPLAGSDAAARAARRGGCAAGRTPAAKRAVRPQGGAGPQPAAGGPGRAARRSVAGLRAPAPSSEAALRARVDRALVPVLDGLEAAKPPRWMAERIWGEERVAEEWSSESWMRAQVRRWIPKARALAEGGWRDLVPRHAPEPWWDAPTVGPNV